MLTVAAIANCPRAISEIVAQRTINFIFPRFADTCRVRLPEGIWYEMLMLAGHCVNDFVAGAVLGSLRLYEIILVLDKEANGIARYLFRFRRQLTFQFARQPFQLSVLTQFEHFCVLRHGKETLVLRHAL